MDFDSLASRAYAEWKLADEAARAEEARLATAWEQHAFGGDPPSSAFKSEAQRLRALANEKLTAALRLMRSPLVEEQDPFFGDSAPSSQLQDSA